MATPTEKSPLLPQIATSPPANLSSVGKTFGNILISIVGAGVLGLPYSFMKTGWLSGIIIIALVAFIAYYAMMLLVWSKRALHRQGFQKIETFGDLGFAVYGRRGKALVDFMVVLCIAGVCVGYMIFMGNTLYFIFSGSKTKPNPNGAFLSRSFVIDRKAGFMWAIFPLELVMNGIRSLTHLAPFSIFADIVNVSAMLTVMVEEVISIVRSVGPHVEAFTGFYAIPYGMGVAIYAFEGVTMILPLELEIEKKHKFGSVLGLAFAFISCIYGGFGALGYVAFGSETKEIVSLNLGKSLIVDCVQLALCLNLFITFPLMMNPVYEVIEGRFNRGVYSFIIRSMTVLLITILALLVPSFTDFLSLIGSSIGCILGFILPALFHLHACWQQSSSVQILADIMLIVFGIVFGIVANKFGHYEKFQFNPGPQNHRGLVALEGEKWAHHRRILNPAFHMEVLKGMIPTIAECGTNLIGDWRKLVSSGANEIDVLKEFSIITSDIISRTAFGSSYAEGNHIFHLLAQLILLAFERSRSAYILGSRFLPTRKNRQQWWLRKEIRRCARQVIESRERTVGTEKSGDYGTDLLGLMMSSNKKQWGGKLQNNMSMTIDEIISECITFYFAGQETTTILLTWTMVLLGMHQDWQERARKEVLEVCGINEFPNADTVNGLKIVGMILNESLRLYPPIVEIIRQTYKPMKLGRVSIPAGTQLQIPILAMHHDPSLWGDSVHEFNPERFSQGISKAAKHPMAFMPFSSGPIFIRPKDLHWSKLCTIRGHSHIGHDSATVFLCDFASLHPHTCTFILT